MDLSHIVAEEYRDRSLREVVAAPLTALRGVTPEAADRLGERIRDLRAVQALLDEKNRHLVEKDAHISHLQEELQRQGAWAIDLERQLLKLRQSWYVRLFGRRTP